MLSDADSASLSRIADALTRLADHYAPARRTEHKPAILGTATYSEEERERLQLKESLKTKAKKPA
jgi:hypothetical protein